VALLVTLWLLARDRRNADRQQIDHLGIWLEPLWLRKLPTESYRLADVKVQASIRNANHVPLRIVQMACEITTSWLVPDDGQPADNPMAWRPEPGTQPQRYFYSNVLIKPDDTWTNTSEHNVEHMAPAGAVQLDVREGVQCAISWVLVIDNAGRRWKLRPGVARRAERFRWYTWRSVWYPPDWRYFKVEVFLHRARDLFRRLRGTVWAWPKRIKREG